jgi:predicted TIM-barrel fold metal-dependent hydrolase
MSSPNSIVVDMHCHVGLVGDTWSDKGGMSEEYRRSAIFKILLLYTGIPQDRASDSILKDRTLAVIESSHIDTVVCLALDPVYDMEGNRRAEKSHLWVDNEYILDLQRELPNRILFGASVHPYDKNFKERVAECVAEGAILIKWLPSAQQFDLGSDAAGEALQYLATAGPDGNPLPVLLHCGPEYAIDTTDARTRSFDYLTWSKWDEIINALRFARKWHKPDLVRLRSNLDNALNAGAIIIFAHCGFPYFFPRPLGRYLEHSEFSFVKEYLVWTSRHKFRSTRKDGSEREGKCFADVSALATPFRKAYYSNVRSLPQELLLYGSDFPTPVFELSADSEEMMEDLRAVLKGDLSRLIVPEDNLLDVAYREMEHAFPGAPLFSNFAKQGFLPRIR